MNNNEVLKQLREILSRRDKLSDEKINAVLGAPSEANQSDQAFAETLNQLVLFKRGENDRGVPQPVELPMTNNIVLKKIRVAFELQEADIAKLVTQADDETESKQWSSYFRKADHKHYRLCPDAFLKNILVQLAQV